MLRLFWAFNHMINLNKIRFGRLGFIYVIVCIVQVLHVCLITADRPRGHFGLKESEPIGIAKLFLPPSSL